ncbi:MiaB/RimO family radical SAM methylthiotransferase [Candidatus Dependentiae bacterium]|nr:MiaB/RimO family radical SAM methylthiotransferase [Candidatus Dependentiae bacterium]
MINFFFKTYGCQANVADSEGLASFLKSIGCNDVASEQEADLVVVNTCAVREKAEQKLYTYLGQLCLMKKNKQYMKIGVIGCVASYKRDEIYKRFNPINFVYGAKEDYKVLESYLADLVVKLETTKQMYDPSTPVIGSTKNEQDLDIKKVIQQVPAATTSLFKTPRMAGSMAIFKRQSTNKGIEARAKELNRSFINIMTGCNKFCAYCIVPFTRGRETSYPMQEIVDRVAHDVANGSKEVTLIGQNVNSYKDPETGLMFAELLRRVTALPGKFWVRWVSPHPQDMTPELFDVIAQHQDRIPPYVHFPMQAGSNRVLELMKRNYSIEQFKEQIGWLRDRVPNATISTDIIVGFPGETEADFAQTMQAVEAIRFDWVYSFNYSPRKHTLASRTMGDDVPQEVKSKRLDVLQTRQIEIGADIYIKHVDKIYEVLVEKRLEDGKLLARTGGNIRTLLEGPDSIIDSFVTVRILAAGPVNLTGELI